MSETNENISLLNKHNKIWNEKLLLRKIYRDFYILIKQNLVLNNTGKIVELGSGIGKIKEIIPECICTDQHDSSYIDGMENAYNLSYQDNSISNLILFDVFHHLKYPGDALKEFNRVLMESGRLLIFEPHLSLLGLLVYGFFHPEPLRLNNKIEWNSASQSLTFDQQYYAAQGNASRIFCWEKCIRIKKKKNALKIIKIPAISYVASGGYTGTQLYPSRFFALMQIIDRLCACLPRVFATRMLIVLEKK